MLDDQRRVGAGLTFHSGVGFDSASSNKLENTDMTMRTYAAALALALLPATAIAQSAPATPSPDREAYRAACSADVQKFCANIEKAKGAMRSCLEAHEKDLSDTCRAARAERAAARAAKDKS
jgi:Cysteine rich repeat